MNKDVCGHGNNFEALTHDQSDLLIWDEVPWGLPTVCSSWSRSILIEFSPNLISIILSCILSDNVNNNHQYFITTTTTTTRKAKDLRTMSWAKVTRGAPRRRRRRRKTKRRPLILLSSDLHFELWTLLFWFLTAHFETGAPVYHPSRVYPTSISNFPIPTSRLIRLVSRSQPTWSRHIIHSETH